VENQQNVARTSSSYDVGPYVFPSNIINDDMCGWNQLRQNDHFDWTRISGATPSTQTGPSRDATSGTGI